MGAVKRYGTGQLQGSRPEQILTSAAVLATGLLCAIVTLVVVSRWFRQPGIPDDVLLVSELMVAVILLPLATVTGRHMHIQVTVFTDWTSINTRKKFSTLGDVFGLIFIGLLLWAGARSLAGALESGEYYDGDLQIPVWIGYALYVSGLSACFLRLVANVVPTGSGQWIRRY